MHATVHPLAHGVFIPVLAVMAPAGRGARGHDQALQQVLGREDATRAVFTLPGQLTAITTNAMVATSFATLRVFLPHARSSGAAR